MYSQKIRDLPVLEPPGTETCTEKNIQYLRNREFNPVLCDNLEGWDGVRGGREGIYVYLELIHFFVQQKPIQHCKKNYPPIKKIFKRGRRKDL